MNSIKLANILLIVVLVLMVGSIAASMITKKTVTTSASGEQVITTKFVGFSGKKAAQSNKISNQKNYENERK